MLHFPGSQQLNHVSLSYCGYEILIKYTETIYTLYFVPHFFKTSKKLSYDKSMGIETQSLMSYDFVWLTKSPMRYTKPIVYMS